MLFQVCLAEESEVILQSDGETDAELIEPEISPAPEAESEDTEVRENSVDFSADESETETTVDEPEPAPAPNNVGTIGLERIGAPTIPAAVVPTPTISETIESEVLEDVPEENLYDQDSQQTEQPVPVEPRPTAEEIVPWALLGLLAGCILGAVLWNFLSRMLKKRKRVLRARSLKVVTLQGLGARENQQDSLAATDPALYKKEGVLLCVADGMGGLQNGSVLSRTAVTAVNNKFPTLEKSDPERVLAILVQTAAAAVNMILGPNLGHGGTTLLLGYAYQGRFYCASVGDSRICLMRDGKLIHLNRPHIFEDELLLRYFNGEISYEDARNYEKKGGLTSYLGMGPLKYVDFPTYHVTIQKGDRFILMSDGIFNTLTDEDIARILSRKPKAISTILNSEIEKKQSRFQDNYSAAVLIAD